MGKFRTGQSRQNDVHPALLIIGYKGLSAAVATSAMATQTIATPPSTKSTSKLAPPGYAKRMPTTPQSPITTSRSQRIDKGKDVATTENIESDSEDESFQTLLNPSIVDSDSIEAQDSPSKEPFSKSGLAKRKLFDEDAEDITEVPQRPSRKRRKRAK